MRVSQKPNRSRGRGSRKPSTGTNVNRVYESSGPEGKVRGTPSQIIEKYISLARDAQTGGHRVVAENFLQHAEHYQRLLAEAMAERQERQQHDSQQPGMERPSTDQPNNPETEAGSEKPAASGSGSGSGRQPREGRGQGENRPNNRPHSRGDGRRDDREPREAEVSGLTMIDSAQGDNGSLLVDVEELGASQPPRRPRRRDQEPAEAPAAPEADAPQPE